MADDRAFVLYDWMAGYGAGPTPERPCDDACERPLLADNASSTKAPEADIREDWDGLAYDRKGR